MSRTASIGLQAISIAFISSALAYASDFDEFKIKREEMFEFVETPTLSRSGDAVSIAFESKGFCDATVAIEDGSGRIVRHLVSGVLGSNAPEPFQKNSKKQTLIWDGKDDQGKYVDAKDSLTVRVSLGLKPRFERALYWEPKKRWSAWNPLIQAAPEGVYVFDNGNGVAQLKLFDHEGNYVRTLYPFPGDKLDQVKGLNYCSFPQIEKPVPLRRGYFQATLLSSGTFATVNDGGFGVGTDVSSKQPSFVASALAVQGDRVALANLKLNRLRTDGTTGGLPLEGPEVFYSGYSMRKNHVPQVGPTCAAFGPDGNRLYLAGYGWTATIYPEGRTDCLSGVAVVDYERNEKPRTFVGTLEPDKRGSGKGEFNCATSVAVDKLGRVYVTDYMNDRVQIFSPEGEFCKEIKVHRPAVVNIHPKTQEIYVFSWLFWTTEFDKLAAENERKHLPLWENLPCKLSKFGPFEDPRKIAEFALPLPTMQGRPAHGLQGVQFWGAVDGYGAKTVVWLGQGRYDRGQGYVDKFDTQNWDSFGIQVLAEDSGKLTQIRDFGKDTKATVFRTRPGKSGTNQMLYVNPANGKLYLWEGDSGCLYKNCQELLEIDPESSTVRPLPLPFSAMDLAFDIDGQLYLRTTDVVARFVPDGTREVPWDYGEEIPSLSSGTGAFDGTLSKRTTVLSGLVMPAQNVVCYMQSGMGISPLGDLAVACGNRPGTMADGLKRGYDEPTNYGRKYSPRVYPGRQSDPVTCCVHIWDKHGQLKQEDAVPGLPQLDGVQIDRKGNLYVMAVPTRLLDGKKHINPMTSTLIKLRPKHTKIISNSESCPVPLPKDEVPNGLPQIAGSLGIGSSWVQNAEWLFGGVSFGAFNGGPGGGCHCWSWARFALDLYARSFAPEPDIYGVAVVDTNGNLIMHIGQYGNADDGMPLFSQGSSPNSRSIGRDEVGLFCAKFVATHSDKRLFIADAGNHRLLSVKLGYYAERRIPLKEVADSAAADK